MATNNADAEEAASQIRSLDSILELCPQTSRFAPRPPPPRHERHFGVLRLVDVQVGEQRDHGDVAGNGEDIN
jgi:hypothetical protein